MSQAGILYTVTTRNYCMQTFKCDICKEMLDVSVAVGRGKNSSKNNYKDSNKAKRCKPCNTKLAREWRKKNPGYRGSGKYKAIPPEDRLLVSAIGQRRQDAKARAKKRNQPCQVSKEYLYELFKKQGSNCALTGVTMKVEKGAITCLSLDQKDPSLGYIEGNVQWVAWAANRAKGDMSLDVFVDMCKKVTEYQKVQRLSKSNAA